jgi:shikimate dehydrogenase
VSDVSGSTRLAGVIGAPVRHSRSPAIHNAGYAAVGLDWVYVAFEVPSGRGGDAVRAVPVLGLGGLNVTMPHKEDAARACDTLSDDAAALQSVNTVVPRGDGSVHGESTDGEGFLRSVADAGLDVAGRSVLVLGSGGAARAVVLALARRGAQVTVAARRPDAAAAAAALAPDVTSAGFDDLSALASGAEVVVNATPLGMAGETLPLDPSVLGPGHWAVDLVYHPEVTPFLAAADAAGARTVGGLGMLVHQAAAAFELMTGVPAPVAALRAGAALNPAG